MTDLSQMSDADLTALQAKLSTNPLAGMSDADLQAMQQQLSTQPAPQTRTDRFLQGLRDPIDAGAQMLAHAMPSWAVNGVNTVAQAADDLPYVGGAFKAAGFTPATPQKLDTDIQQREKDYQAQRAVGAPLDAQGKPDPGIDWMRGGGAAVGSAPLMLAAPAAGTGYGGALLLGAGTGAVSGALNPVTTPTGDFWTEKGKEAGKGALFGSVFGPATTAASRVVQPVLSEAVQTLADRGVAMTPGQIMGGAWKAAEEKLTSVPFVGDLIRNGQRRSVEDLNRAAYNEVLAPIGQTFQGPVGREGVAAVRDAIGNRYDALLPNLRFSADNQFAADINNLTTMAGNLPQQQAQQFQNVLRDQVIGKLSNTGMMDGQTLKGVESELSRISSGYRSDPSFDNRQLGAAIGEITTALRSNLQRTNPDQAAELGALNAAWARFARLRDGAARIGADEGVMTPAQLQSAVRAGDRSVGKGQFATGNALMQDLSEAGKSVLGNKYPDSGTPGRYLLGAMLGGGLAGHPLLPLAGAAMALPYSAMGQRALSYLMTQRPTAVTAPLAATIRNAAPALGTGVQSALSPLLGP